MEINWRKTLHPQQLQDGRTCPTRPPRPPRLHALLLIKQYHELQVFGGREYLKENHGRGTVVQSTAHRYVFLVGSIALFKVQEIQGKGDLLTGFLVATRSNRNQSFARRRNRAGLDRGALGDIATVAAAAEPLGNKRTGSQGRQPARWREAHEAEAAQTGEAAQASGPRRGSMSWWAGRPKARLEQLRFKSAYT